MKGKLLTHLYFGDPSVAFSFDLAQVLVKNGADMLEIGIPYSDPVCDGEVFQHACLRALESGITPVKVLEGIRSLRKKITNPIYVTSYYGPIFKMGEEKFMRLVSEIGAQGVIIPDILFEEQSSLLRLGEKYKIAVIQFATPYSTHERLEKIVAVAKDFVYCISVPGVTGARNEVEKKTFTLVQKVQAVIKQQKKDLKIYVGFGISKPEHVKKMIQGGADGVIVGSAIGRKYESSLALPTRALHEIGMFIQSLEKAL